MTEIFENLMMQISRVEGINYVDEDWGQLTDFGQNCPVKWPCVLIDEQSEVYSDIGTSRGLHPANRQEGTLSIVLTFANLKLTNGSARAPQGQQQQNWLIKRLKQSVHEAIHGWAPVQGHGKLMRQSGRKIVRDDGVQQYQVVYTIGLHNV